jgi:hypothetical protein
LVKKYESFLNEKDIKIKKEKGLKSILVIASNIFI